MLGGGFINAGVLFTVRIVLGKSGMIDSGIPLRCRNLKVA
jgi:hypothetical protein